MKCASPNMLISLIINTKSTLGLSVFLLSISSFQTVYGVPCYSCISSTTNRSQSCIDAPRNGALADLGYCEGRFCTKIWGFLDDGTDILIRGCTETIRSSCNMERISLRYDLALFSSQLAERYFTRGCAKACRWALCNASSYLINNPIKLILLLYLTLII
ncbi:uncharacterized protein LOC107364959 [Tetranychus urticae]|uniref:Uncharacterized protein n=1 Tax=Tetranychus urticae TaxID=32264 RepID=T1KK22_TETUR|nr:uncharacterized protein LOC107364959 [Tetranychus urticae]XP_025017205.1 uncharacterized protein LOC107364959 [Tetranychus urticae]